MFLLAFGEFEIASMWGVKTWTVTLFDAQAGGLPIWDSLKLAAAPLICEAVPLLGCMALIARTDLRTLSPLHQRPFPGGRIQDAGALVYASAAALVACVFPLALVFTNAIAGLSSLFENFALGKEIGASIIQCH